jgi:hypothetical protein
MDGQVERSTARVRSLPPANVRVLQGDEELAEAVARAAACASRLDDRLAARAARDAWMAEHTSQRAGWLRFVRRSTVGDRIVAGDDPLRRSASPRRSSPSSPAA